MSLNNLFGSDTEYKKRVMVLVTKRMLNPKRGGGVSTFVRGIAKALPDDTLVEIHCVGADNLEVYEIQKPNIKTFAYPQSVKIKAEEPGMFQRIMINFDQIEEFRVAINKAIFSYDKLYDAIITTCPESALACISFGALIESFNVIYTTHHGLMSDSLSKVPFDDSVIYFANEVIPKSGFVTTVTQTPLNAEWLLEKHGVKVDHVIPLLPDEMVYANGDRTGKEGVLFIGKYETGKRPDWYVTMLRKTGLKGKILCAGAKGPEVWKRELAKEGVTNYEIGFNLQGKEKEDFISSARFTWITSMNESFGYLALEGLAAGPTMIFESRWAEFWRGYGATIFGRGGRFELAKELHEINDWNSDHIREMVEAAKVKWIDVVLNSRKHFGTSRTSSALKSLTPNWIAIKQVMKDRGVRGFSATDYKPFFDYCDVVHTTNETKIRLRDE